MNPTAILSLIGSLWQQLAEAQARASAAEAKVAELEGQRAEVAHESDT